MPFFGPVFVAALLAIPMSGFGPLCINSELQPAGSQTAKCVKSADEETEDKTPEEVTEIASAPDEISEDGDGKTTKKSRKRRLRRGDRSDNADEGKTTTDPDKGSASIDGDLEEKESDVKPAAPPAGSSSERVAGSDRGD